jgi:hypothetical protein
MLFKRDGDIDKKTFNAAERKADAKSGAAEADGSFPIKSAADVKNAVRDWGRAGSKPADKAHIIARARAIGATSALPDNWTKRAIAKDGDGDEGATLFDDTVDANEAHEDASDYAEAMCHEIQEANCALYESIRSILDDDEVEDKQSMLEQTFAQYKDHVSTIVPEGMEKALKAFIAKGNLQKDTDDMTKEEFAKAVADEVAKAVAPLNETIAKLGDENAILKLSDKHKSYMDAADMSDEAKKKFAAKSADERDAHMADNPIGKNYPEHVRKAMAEADAIKKANEEMAKRLAALEGDKQLATLQKRATDAGLPVEFGEVLQKAKAGDGASVDALVEKYAELNKAREAALKAGGIFKEFGTSRGATGDALSQLNAKADELRKSDPKLSHAQAFAKVYSDPANRELAAQEKVQRLNKAATAA